MEYFPDFDPKDGTIQFYLRLQQLIAQAELVVDVGCGRGGWLTEDACATRRSLRPTKDNTTRLIGIDVDKEALLNPLNTETRIIVDHRFPLDSSSADLVIADYVLEHIESPPLFVSEIDRILKPGGFFAARTPHKYNIAAIGNRTLPSSTADWLLRIGQPHRKQKDVFPAFYRMNTLMALKGYFPNYSNYSFLHTSEPVYFTSNSTFKWFQQALFAVVGILNSNILVFLQKPKAEL